MTFPIDRKEPGDIPEFRHIFELFPGDEEVLARLLRYLCLRYDPKYDSNTSSPEKRRKHAEEVSGFTGPGEPPYVNEDGDLVIPPNYQVVMDVTSMFFAILNNNDWEEICSLEFMIAEAHEIMRSPIPKGANSDMQLKLSELKSRLSDSVAKMSTRLKGLRLSLSEGDELGKQALANNAIERKRRDLTGRIKEE